MERFRPHLFARDGSPENRQPERCTAPSSDDQARMARRSAGVVKVLDGQGGARDPRDRRCRDMRWEPKAAFDVLADWFR